MMTIFTLPMTALIHIRGTSRVRAIKCVRVIQDANDIFLIGAGEIPIIYRYPNERYRLTGTY